MAADDQTPDAPSPVTTHYGSGSGSRDFYFSAKKAAHEAAGWTERTPGGATYLLQRTQLCTFLRRADHPAGAIGTYNVSVPFGTADVKSVCPFWDDLVKVGSGKIQGFGRFNITVTNDDETTFIYKNR